MENFKSKYFQLKQTPKARSPITNDHAERRVGKDKPRLTEKACQVNRSGGSSDEAFYAVELVDTKKKPVQAKKNHVN